jgi:hypothetical protein
LGRFIQPDDRIPDLSNPQSYNRYSYVLNNPLRYTDPDGHAGKEVADWWSARVGTAAEFYSASPSHWIWNGTVGTVNSLVGGVAEPLRLGSTAGALSGSGHVTAGQVALGTVQEVGRAAAIVPVGAAIGKGVGTLAGAVAGTAEREAVGAVASQVGNAAGKVGGAANQAGGAAAQTTSKVDNLLQQIEQSGAKVKLNPKSASQEGNVTLVFGNQGRVNVRVETHPLTPNGPPVRHANVETVTEAAGKKTVENIHITQ